MRAKRLTKGQTKQLRFRNGGLLPQSRSVYGAAVKSYFQYLLDNSLEDEFDIASIQDWLSEYRNAATYNVRLQGIKEFYMEQFKGKSAVKRLMVRESFESIRRKRPALSRLAGIDFLPESEVRRIASRLTPRARCIVMALFWTGCRISELLDIRIEDCMHGDPVVIRVVGKGQKERHVYLPIDEYRRIMTAFEGDTYLFENRAGGPMNRCFVSHELRRQSIAKCGVSIHPHTLRHSKAMFLLKKGLSLDQIAIALGHANISTTQGYLHAIPGAREQGIPTERKLKKGA